MKPFLVPVIFFVLVFMTGIFSIKKEKKYFDSVPIVKGVCNCTYITKNQCDSITTIAVKTGYSLNLSAALYYSKGFVYSMKMPSLEYIPYDKQFEFLIKRRVLTRRDIEKVKAYLEKIKCNL